MSEDGKTVDMETTVADEVDGAVVENEPTENAEMAAEATPRKKKRLGPWFFLVLIFIGLPAGWFFSPPEIRQQAQDALAELIPRKTMPDAVKQPLTADSAAQTAERAPNATPIPQAISDMPAADNTVIPSSDDIPSPMPQSTSVETDVSTSISDEENMRGEVKRLQAGLAVAQLENKSLRQQMQESQKQTLSILLRMLARPQTRFVQQAELWGDVASLPGLDEQNRVLARHMAELADKNMLLSKNWQKALTRLAERIPEAEEADILPKPENQYFAWLVGNFHLRPAPQQADVLQTGLRHRLMDTAHALSFEMWPEQSKWATLISDVHQRFATDAGLSESEVPELELPEPELLPHVLQDMAILHKAASKWLEAL